MPYADRATRLAYLREYRSKNPDVRDRSARSKDRRERARAYARGVKSTTPCMDCGQQFPWFAMDFDHRPDETKLMDISKLVNRMSAISTLAAEIAKCDIVCAVCHRIRTFSRAFNEDGSPVDGFGSNASATKAQRAARARRRRAHVDRMQRQRAAAAGD